jgi:hypothetical protein
MANAEYSENPDLKYKVKGKHGLSKKAISKPGSKSPAVTVKYPAIKVKSGHKFIKKGK